MEYDRSELRGRIIAKFGTIGKFADAVGTSNVVISRKLQNKSGITANNIDSWASALDISTEEYGRYFYAKKV